MRTHPLVLSVVVAILSCAATAGALLSMPASASVTVGGVKVVTGLTYKVNYSEIIQVQPGDVSTDTALCPSGSDAAGGGYNLKGVDALTVASAVSNYPAKSASGRDSGWATTVANPKLATGPVELEVKVVCVQPTYSSVGG